MEVHSTEYHEAGHFSLKMSDATGASGHIMGSVHECDRFNMEGLHMFILPM